MIVIASTSRYRAELLTQAGIDFEATAPDFDERAADDLFKSMDPGDFALHLARGKALSVAHRFDGRLIVAADQLAVIESDEGPILLHKAPTESAAVEQLMRMSGRVHDLINGVVVIDRRQPTSGTLDMDSIGPGRIVTGIDRNRVSMRAFSESEARDYVQRFQPFDCVGSYRIEDDSDLLASIECEDRSGIIGLPIPLLRRMLADCDTPPRR